MPKVILEFELPMENEEFELAKRGPDYSCVLWDLDCFLRNKIKYENLSEEKEEIFQEVRDKLYEFLNDRDLNL